jgi:hypothetical protein
MNCQHIQNAMMDYLTRALSAAEHKAFTEHLTQCPACEKLVKEFESVWEDLNALEDVPVPAFLQENIVQTARKTVEADADTSPGRLWNSLKGLLKTMTPIWTGLLVTSVFAFILSFRIDLELIHPLGLTIAGALWTGLFALVFYLFSLGSRQPELSWKFLAQASLIAVSIFIVMTFINPLPNSVRFCSNYQLTQPFIERLSIGGAYFLFGSLYALIPMSLAAYLSAGGGRGNPLLRGSLAGGMFMLLIIPGIFLQCAPFALGVVLGWFGGALVGSVIGGAIGYWIRYRFTES